MSSLSSNVVRTSCIVIGVSLDAEVNQLTCRIADSAGLRFRSYLSVDRLIEAVPDGSAGCVLLQKSKFESYDQTAAGMQRLQTELGQLPVIMLAESCPTTNAVQLMRLGAYMVLEFPVDHETLHETIQAACQWSSETLSSCEESFNVRRRMREATDKELEVLDLVMAGQKNKDIADQLGITIRAVEDRRIRLMKKLQVESLAELIELAVIFRRAERDKRLAGRLIRRGHQPRRFVRGIEVWEPDRTLSRLVLNHSVYRDASAMETASRGLSFAMDEGLPGEVWQSGRPVFYQQLTSGPFRRSEAAAASGLTTGVGFPIFRNGRLQSVVLLLLDGGEVLRTAVEHWQVNSTSQRYELAGAVYANCEKLRRLSEHVSFPLGSGLPGVIGERLMPYIGTRFSEDSNAVRGVAIASEELISGIGLPLTDSGRLSDDVLLLLNSDSTPLFRLLQIWKPGRDAGDLTLFCEALNGERTLHSKCNRSISVDSDSIVARTFDVGRPHVSNEAEVVNQLVAQEHFPLPTVAMAIPTLLNGKVIAVSILAD